MYIVTNHTDGTETRCDAIEYISVDGKVYKPAEQDAADGFKALTIVREDASHEHYEEAVYVFEGHMLHGIEPTGSFESEEKAVGK